MALTFDFINSIIEVPSPTTSVSVQTLINEIRDAEDELNPAMTYPKIADAFGKQDLGGGSLVGITLVLLNDWRLRFQARPGPDTVACIVTGGNLVAVSGNPIAASAYTTVTIAQSSSPTIAVPDSDTNLLYLVESLVSKNRSIGSYIYWNPTTGDDASEGTTPAKAVLTFAQAQTLATSGNGDTIFCMATDASGITTVTERLNVTKNNLRIRGSGYNFQLIPSTPGTATVIISADNVELSGLYITTAAGGTDNGITVTGDNALINDSWIKATTGVGIHISSAARTKITTCAIEDATGNGITMGTGTTLSKISTCIISSCADGVELSGSSISDNIFENNLIYNNSGYGIDVGADVLRTGVRLNHTFSGNTSGSTRDLGTGTFIESSAGGASASEIADAVWDEVITGHTTASTAGRTLRDAKTRATLASLK
jgi:hypothetical protein